MAPLISEDQPLLESQCSETVEEVTVEDESNPSSSFNGLPNSCITPTVLAQFKAHFDQFPNWIEYPEHSIEYHWEYRGESPVTPPYDLAIESKPVASKSKKSTPQPKQKPMAQEHIVKSVGDGHWRILYDTPFDYISMPLGVRVRCLVQLPVTGGPEEKDQVSKLKLFAQKGSVLIKPSGAITPENNKKFGKKYTLKGEPRELLEELWSWTPIQDILMELAPLTPALQLHRRNKKKFGPGVKSLRFRTVVPVSTPRQVLLIFDLMMLVLLWLEQHKLIMPYYPFNPEGVLKADGMGTVDFFHAAGKE